jgi:hypothetical protein
MSPPDERTDATNEPSRQPRFSTRQFGRAHVGFDSAGTVESVGFVLRPVLVGRVLALTGCVGSTSAVVAVRVAATRLKPLVARGT